MRTYTVQARIKKNNRRTELLLRQAELWSALAGRLIAKRPVHDAFSRLWKQLLLHQFHDILPGSSIARVYEEANSAHERMQSECVEIIRESMHLLSSGEGVTCFNSLSWPVTQVISLDERFSQGAMTPEGVSVPVLNG